MVKVRVLDLGKMAYGGYAQDNYASGVYTQPAQGGYNGTLQPVDRDEANIEAEKGEVVVGDIVNNGTNQTFKIGGDNHATPGQEAMGKEGGTPLNIADGFIFSKRMYLDSEEKKYFDINKNGRVSFAEAAEKYMNNKYLSKLENDTSDDIDKETAELKIAENNEILTKLALLQESKKGFDGGLPQGAEDVLANYNIEQSEIMPQEEQPQMAYGGKFVGGGDTKRTYNLPYGKQGEVYFQTGQDDMYNNLALLDEKLSDENLKAAIKAELEGELNGKIKNAVVAQKVREAIADPDKFDQFIESFKKINFLNQVAKSRGYNQQHTGNHKQAHDEYYKYVSDLIDRPTFDALMRDGGDEGIGFQAIFTGLSRINENNNQYNIGVTARGKDDEHYNDKRKTGIRFKDTDTTSSAIDGLIWDNTLQQTAIANPPKPETPPEQPAEQAPAERPAPTKEITEAARPPYGWSRGDIRNYMNSLLDYYTERKYGPYMPRLEYQSALPYHVNFEQGVNQLQSQANSANEMASQYGPQAAAAMMQATQANIIPGIAQYIDQSNKTNQGFDNQWALQEMANRNNFAAQKAALEKQYYDESVASQQNYDNAKRALRHAALAYRNIGESNASQTWNENMMHPKMRIDPYTRRVMYVPEADTPVEPGAAAKSGTEQYLAWFNSYGKNLPEEMQLAMFYHLTGTTPTGRDTTEKYNLQQQKARDKEIQDLVKSLQKTNS